MSSTQIVVIVVLVVVVALLAVGLSMLMRRRSLRQRFGPEYDRAVSTQDSRLAAERELRQRERRHAELELRPLSEESRARYAQAWQDTQANFVDAPHHAVGAADELLTRLVAERGYPTGDYDEQVTYLSVEHAGTLSRYRAAHEISVLNDRGEATIEQLRQALLDYRALFAELLSDEPVGRSDTDPRGSSRDTSRDDVEAVPDRYVNGRRPYEDRSRAGYDSDARDESPRPVAETPRSSDEPRSGPGR
jgi:hypothetical protein